MAKFWTCGAAIDSAPTAAPTSTIYPKKTRSTVMSAPVAILTRILAAIPWVVRPGRSRPLLLFQHQVAALANHALRRVGEAREQPWQRDFEAHSRLIDIDDAGRVLSERRDAEGQPISSPDL